MRVVLVAAIGGTRDGVEWPDPGSVVDLPDDEAVGLLSSGAAKPVEAAAPAASSERAVEKKGAEKR